MFDPAHISDIALAAGVVLTFGLGFIAGLLS